MSVALSRIPGHRRARRCCGRSTSIPTAASSRRPAAPCRCSTTTTWRCWVTGRPIRASPIACRRRSIASSTCSCPTARSACGGPIVAGGRMAAELCARLPAARPRPADGGARRLAAARPDLAQPHAEKMSPNAQAYAWYVLAKARPRRSRPRSATSRTRRPPTSRAGSPGRSSPPRSTRSASPAARGSPSRWPASTSTSAIRHDYYGSPLRNRAALLALATEAGGREGVGRSRERGARAAGRQDRPDDDAGAGLAGAGGAGDERRRRARLLGRRRASARRRPSRS